MAGPLYFARWKNINGTDGDVEGIDLAGDSIAAWYSYLATMNKRN